MAGSWGGVARDGDEDCGADAAAGAVAAVEGGAEAGVEAGEGSLAACGGGWHAGATSAAPAMSVAAEKKDRRGLREGLVVDKKLMITPARRRGTAPRPFTYYGRT